MIYIVGTPTRNYTYSILETIIVVHIFVCIKRHAQVFFILYLVYIGDWSKLVQFKS